MTDRIQKWLQQVSVMRYQFQQREQSCSLFRQHPQQISIVIKIPCRSWLGAFSWGDFHMAVALQKALKNLGFNVLLQVLPEWDAKEGEQYDVVIVFRGLNRYKCKAKQLNIMWNISHPEDVTLEEYEEYDHVFIASDIWAKEISQSLSKPVECMLQCTDTQRFFPPSHWDKKCDKETILFVGGTRDVFRPVIKELLPTEYSLAVYGKNWPQFIDKKYIKGAYIPNELLYKYYGSAGIVLNDHWDDMRSKGFVSNRIFDALACGAVVVSDKVEGMGEIATFVQTYDDKYSLKQCLEFSLQHSNEVQARAYQGMKFVQREHTFGQRAKQFAALIHRHLDIELAQ
ncbi:MAG: Unknown protein [uncultured Thiotrichaceae bacterium]|uniref:Spore protein YkvP/CgeB glycosyl transferase-like domain-containing protein n=1 Tax=uncultured Thiotrichaceae bacterium TaxID=298394 RepID=A0A6S6SJM8_9GAMM|nr:MAG: Unknown protein [uncultured Thiotrichaceae bacterium]